MNNYIAAGSILTAFITGAMLGGCAATPEREAVEFVVEENPKVDFAAIKFYDCGQFTGIVFVKRDGSAEGVPIRGPGMLDDMHLRASKLPYMNVHFYENNRPCGIVIDEAEAF